MSTAILASVEYCDEKLRSTLSTAILASMEEFKMRRWINEAVSLDIGLMHAHPECTAILASMEDSRCVDGRIVEKKVDQASALACLGAVVAYWCISSTKGMIGGNIEMQGFYSWIFQYE
jgi:hypothetical protein